jgi:general secretion pathway protein H
MTSRARSGDRSTAGFSLIEMLVVMAILALVGAVLMPVLARPSETLRLQANARDLLGALRVTRAAAIAGNAELALMIDVEERTFESPAVARRSLDPDIAAKITFAEPLRQSRSHGGFSFFPDGSSTGGDVRLTLNGREAKICVDWFTGAARQAADC